MSSLFTMKYLTLRASAAITILVIERNTRTLENIMPQTQLLSALPSLSSAELDREIAAPARLVLDRARARSYELVEAWAPFDHINTNARLVLVGLTPGRHQMGEALRAARTALVQGASEAEALAAAKVYASFSGPMRANLVALLDTIGVAARLGLGSTAELWGRASHLVHFTSALRYPVFRNGANWSGSPGPLAVPMLRARIETTLAAEIGALAPDALFVPLGPKAAEALAHAAGIAGVGRERILVGLPHPSGANAERIAVFLGRKAPGAASAQTDAARLLAARATLATQVRRAA